MKFFIGPVTKNTIDTVINYSNKNNVNFVFIPSRRQIEYNGGYVNNFKTSEFIEYVKLKTNNILFERDHSGPNQGKINDDGYESLMEDCKYFDIIHIDPWKKYPLYNDALEWTIKMIEFCYENNPNIIYEIGTEEGIRPIEVNELDNFVNDIKNKLKPEIFDKIKYLVIQCGTKLLEQSNIGIYDSDKLNKMIDICTKYNLISKEHNGDWVDLNIIKEKENQGLKCINIAPEFGEIESSVIIKNFNEKDLNKFYEICYKSNTWKKWVSPDFNPENNKEKLIKICGHYNFANDEFVNIKNKYENLDKDICKAINNKLMSLNY
jgi:hypothetical protein